MNIKNSDDIYLHIHEYHVYNDDKMIAVKLPKTVNTFKVETTIKGEWDYDAYHLTCFRRTYLVRGYTNVDWETFKDYYPKSIKDRLETIEKEIYSKEV